MDAFTWTDEILLVYTCLHKLCNIFPEKNFTTHVVYALWSFHPEDSPTQFPSASTFAWMFLQQLESIESWNHAKLRPDSCSDSPHCLTYLKNGCRGDYCSESWAKNDTDRGRSRSFQRGAGWEGVADPLGLQNQWGMFPKYCSIPSS